MTSQGINQFFLLWVELSYYARLLVVMQVSFLGYLYERLKELFGACCFLLVIYILLSMMNIKKTKIQFIQSMRKNYNSNNPNRGNED